MSSGTYDPEDRTHDPDVLQTVLDIIMSNLIDAIRLACIEKKRRRCHLCVMTLASDSIDDFFVKNGPDQLERIGAANYMAKVVRFGRAETFRILKDHECSGFGKSLNTLLRGNTTCH